MPVPRITAASVGAALLVSAAAAPAAAQGGLSLEEGELPPDSQSVGYADDGHLEEPFAVEPGHGIKPVARARYGTREMVGLLNRAAAAVTREAPGSVLAVGDLSSEGGGKLEPHGSHQSGRDADIGFYMLREDGREVPRGMFLQVREDGTARGRGGARFRFDVPRNWKLLVAFVDDPMAEVQHVLLVEHLRERLLEYARSIDAPEDQIRRVELVTKPITGSENHDDHYHVRIYCSVGDRPHCLDKPPLHPWYYGTPSPEAVAAARVSDLRRAAALRRAQNRKRDAEAQLRRGRALTQARIEAMARELAREPHRQMTAERRRAAALSLRERRALRELQQQEAELQHEQRLQRAAERGRNAKLAAERRRWEGAERRRAERLRAEARRFEERERRRAAELRAQARRAQVRERRRDAELRGADRDTRAMLKRAQRQQAADRRRARQLMQQGERLREQRARQD